jgi:hypothetical protein
MVLKSIYKTGERITIIKKVASPSKCGLGLRDLKRRPNETLSKGYLDWNGALLDNCDGAGVSANNTTASIDTDTGPDKRPTDADPAATEL